MPPGRAPAATPAAGGPAASGRGWLDLRVDGVVVEPLDGALLGAVEQLIDFDTAGSQ